MSRDELTERRERLCDFIAFNYRQRQRLADELAEAERESNEACGELMQIETALAADGVNEPVAVVAGDVVECTAELRK